MIFFSSEKNEDIKLVTNNTEIEKVRSCKYLGIYIDDELNYHVHIDYIFNKLLKFTGIFYKLRANTIRYEMITCARKPSSRHV